MMLIKRKLKNKIWILFILAVLIMPFSHAYNTIIPAWQGNTNDLYYWNNEYYFIPKNMTDNIYLNLDLYSIYAISNITLLNGEINIYDNISNISLITISNNTITYYNPQPNTTINYTTIYANQPYTIQIIVYPDNTTIFINNLTFTFNFTASNIYLQPLNMPCEIAFSNWIEENNNYIISNDFDFLVFILVFILVSFVIVIYIIDIKVVNNE